MNDNIRRYLDSFNNLFRPGPNTSMNACVGTNGGPYDFSSYGEGFFVSGFNLVEAAKSGACAVDILVYPIAFNFRHGIELYSKHLIRKLAEFNNSGTNFERSHSIVRNWDIVINEAVSSKIFNEKEQLEHSIAKDIIEEFEEIDARGEVFRYPVDKKGNTHLDISIINIEILRDGMRVLFDILESTTMTIDVALEERYNP